MDFGLSEDQILLEETLRSFLSDRVPIERVRELRHEDCPNDPEIWGSLAELGMTGILLPEQSGGSELGLLDACIAAQCLGHAVTPTPFLGSAVMVPMALAKLDHPEIGTWLSGIGSGELRFGVAITETFSVREGAGLTIEGGKVSGKAMMSWDICGADFILVASGSDRLAVIRGDADGIGQTRLATTDETRCTSELTLENVECAAIFEDASESISRMLDAGRIALAADCLGACEAMIEQAVAYAKERKQFERVIGSFQAVKHMCAEMISELEPARALVWYAAHSFDASPSETPLLACHALSHVSEIGREIASVATQVHGGIGWTDEQNLHFWFKRIGVARGLLGGPHWLRERAASLQNLDKAS
ncbi:MAG: acyl-CoA/acyl-ACP dehydrogenase [Myxococcota bacterium]|jgi:alkylation response protein AidB-like acyl-CoA dehydrogenase|nr:acyl-CoA/acyl-ACP dehydrogenase [Myxococcota bacterium]